MKPSAYWEKNNNQFHKSKLLLVHLSRIESGALDIIQGGRKEDKEGIPVYKKLDSLLKNPEIRAKLVKAMKPLMKDQTDPEEEHVYKKDLAFLQDVAPKSFEKPSQRKGDAEVHQIEEMGVGGDDSLGWVPESFVELAIDIGYKPIQNPHTHLLMFGKGPLDEKQKRQILSQYAMRGNIKFENGRPYADMPGQRRHYYEFDEQNRPFYRNVAGRPLHITSKADVESLRRSDKGFWGDVRALAKPLVRIAAPIAAVAMTPFTGGGSLALLGTSALAGGASYGAHRLTGAKHKEAIAPALGGALAGLAGGIGPKIGLNASLSTGAGQTAGQLLGGAKPKQALLAGALHGAGHYGLSKLNEAGHLPSWMGGKAPVTPSQQALAALRNPHGAPSAVDAASSAAAGAAAPEASSSWLNMSNIAPVALAGTIAGLTYHTQKKRAEEKKKHEEEKVKHHKADIKAFEQQKRALGFEEPLKLSRSEKDRDWKANPLYGREPEWASDLGIFYDPWIKKNKTPTPLPELSYSPPPGYETASYHAEGGRPASPHASSHGDSWYHIVDEGLSLLEHSPEWAPTVPRRYATGGHVTGYFDDHDGSNSPTLTEGTLIKGPGKGQEDLIKTTVPENSYIIDASTTSMLGDGSTDAGARVLKQFEEEIKERAPDHQKSMIMERIHRNARPLPVYLSDGEYGYPPFVVSLLGAGSEKKGSAILKTMVKNIRKDKSKNGSGLPSKAKSPWHYIEKRGMQ